MEQVIALITLAAMEIVLGIDNIVFIAILTSRLPPAQQPSARRWGLGLALISRILLLFSLSYVMQLDKPVFYLSEILESAGIASPWETPEPAPEGTPHVEGSPDEASAAGEAAKSPTGHAQHKYDPNGISIKDLILILGGLFLLWKSTVEIHKKIEGEHEEHVKQGSVSYSAVLIQIMLLDIIFSLDSVITAVGMAKHLEIMVAAVIIAVIVMMIFANGIANFVERNPTIKMLALSFLILIGVMLMIEGLGTHIDKGYIYFAMAFSLVVEMLNMRMRNAARKKAAAASH